MSCIKSGAQQIAAERSRQVLVEHFTVEHDAAHTESELLAAAECYLIAAQCKRGDDQLRRYALEHWPWEWDGWKPADKIRNLVKAGALIAAEIDRLQRMR